MAPGCHAAQQDPSDQVAKTAGLCGILGSIRLEPRVLTGLTPRGKRRLDLAGGGGTGFEGLEVVGRRPTAEASSFLPVRKTPPPPSSLPVLCDTQPDLSLLFSVYTSQVSTPSVQADADSVASAEGLRLCSRYLAPAGRASFMTAEICLSQKKEKSFNVEVHCFMGMRRSLNLLHRSFKWARLGQLETNAIRVLQMFDPSYNQHSLDGKQTY
ncbi:hypothetical protein M5K25_010876 [Dendrobium thyrsiflorum]|uniref:Uncharacterized protein n=1 Tax=Dendrobium thyrsiflorum TaxID=117978 RepID=A0ABD0V1B3_DENTH